jgi:outer membrane protein TolC
MKRCLFLGLAALILGFSPGSAEPQPINLEAALRLAGAKSLALEAARERVREARSQLDQEKRQLFPWVAPGLGYRRHDGNLQDIVGDVFNASKQSGTAALTLQAQLDLGDALYRVLAAKQAVAASEAGAEARRRETILAVAAAYTELSRAVANVVTAGEAEQISRKTLEQVRAAVTAGLAFAGDAQRVEVQLGRNEAQLLEARQAVRVASARLAQLLRLPLADELRPDLAEFVPVALVSTNRALESLVASALSLRPELRRSDATVNLAQTRRDGATKGVWLPTVGALAAFGGLAGGRNGNWGNGDDFQDYAIGLSWRVGPGGIGDRSRIRTTDARLRIAELEREQLRDEVVREVVELRSRAELSAEQVMVVTRTVAAARRLVELTQARREFGVGVVLEAIEAERELSRAQAEQLQAVAAHNRAQWELWHASGQDETTVRPETRP